MRGTIYRIVGVSHPELQYVGSTMDELRYRWKSHKNQFKTWLTNKDKYVTMSIYPYFELYGIEDFMMLKIKQYNVCDKKHLSAYEQLWMNKINCVNKYNALGGYKCKFFQKYENAMRRDNNKEHIKLHSKEWRQKNKDIIRMRKQTLTICECGREVTRACLWGHRQTKQHKLFETDGIRYMLSSRSRANPQNITTETANLNIID